ncbi:hypothetical protein ABTZ03_43350 [Kitasatospora sp. NPDC096077]|uniref:hypothetical protein n=1 Tax=Kitasatospora sp. NPDC096077 TaxID=3155544 RepID=UPI003322C68F
MPDVPLVDRAAARAAVLSPNRTLAVEFGPRGVCSAVVTPGPTRTRLWAGSPAPNGSATAATTGSRTLGRSAWSTACPTWSSPRRSPSTTRVREN